MRPEAPFIPEPVDNLDFEHREVLYPQEPMHVAADCALRAVNFVLASAAYSAEWCGAWPAGQCMFKSGWTYLLLQVKRVRLSLDDAGVFAAVTSHFSDFSFISDTFHEQVSMTTERFLSIYPEHRSSIENCGPELRALVLIAGLAIFLCVLWLVAVGLLRICRLILYYLSSKKNCLEDAPEEK